MISQLIFKPLTVGSVNEKPHSGVGVKVGVFVGGRAVVVAVGGCRVPVLVGSGVPVGVAVEVLVAVGVLEAVDVGVGVDVSAPGSGSVGTGVPLTPTSLMIVRAVVEAIGKPSSPKKRLKPGMIGWKFFSTVTTTRSVK